MRSSIRLWSRIALLTSLGVAQLIACSSDRRDPSADERNTGSLVLALEATAPSGAVYRLRNAVFEITNVRTGAFEDFLFSDNGDPTASELTTILNSGDYTVTLREGWFLERVRRGDGGGSAGSAGSAGSGGTAGRGGGMGGKGGFAGRGGVAGAIGFPTSPFPGDVDSAGAPSIGGEGGISGGGGGGNFPEVVEAQLLSNAVQFFSLFGGDDAFVSYLFRVGGEQIDFTKGKLHIGVEVIEDPSVCEIPDGVLNTQRVLLETNVDALATISLFDVLSALTSNGGVSGDPLRLYQEILDSYATADRARLPDAIHCGDETTNGVPTLNGYPIECNRIEHLQIDNLGAFFATAFVNRMDLAPENGAHCGQQRMIFSNNALNRMFIILEAQIPNPNPELGLGGCRPLAQFWLDQNTIDDPFQRGARLAEAFTVGDPGLLMAGFGPFYTASNLTVGSGQIRTNQFDQSPWTLREFKLALDGSNVTAIPFPTAEAPHGALWNENADLPQGPACRESFLGAVDQLLSPDLGQLSFVVDHSCKDAESRNDFSQDYPSQLSDGFRAQLEERLAGTGINAQQLATRAQFVGSCIGCHEEAAGRDLGQRQFAPFSHGFVHVQEFPIECGSGNPGFCFPPSPALRTVFLPSRLQTFASLLEIPVIPNPCDSGGGGFGGVPAAGAGPVGGAFPTAGSMFGGTSSGGSTGVAGGRPMPGTGGSPPRPTPPAPEIDIRLPQASTPIAELEEQDAAIRDAYGEKTVSGRSAQVTH